jgi:hypothetical protein
MGRAIGRNDPCPCGSGKKYKKCCLRRERATVPPAGGDFRFEPGSYGGPDIGFAPSIVCYKRVGTGWVDHFVLANPGEAQAEEGMAESLAAGHLEIAFAEKHRGGSDEAVALKLRSLGYVAVDDYRLMEPEDEDSDWAEGGWRGPSPEAGDDEDLGYNPRARRAIFEAIDNQLRDNDPPETRETLDRLIASGHTKAESRELIAAVLAAEIFHVLGQQEEFDQARYVAALHRLPELPEGLEEEE